MTGDKRKKKLFIFFLEEAKRRRSAEGNSCTHTHVGVLETLVDDCEQRTGNLVVVFVLRGKGSDLFGVQGFVVGHPVRDQCLHHAVLVQSAALPIVQRARVTVRFCLLLLLTLMCVVVLPLAATAF